MPHLLTARTLTRNHLDRANSRGGLDRTNTRTRNNNQTTQFSAEKPASKNAKPQTATQTAAHVTHP